MRLRCRLSLFLCLCLLAPAGGGGELTDHPSPYLALHADDPVQWRSWRPQLLAQAQQEGKLLFISSGYFACYWCHVMQRESFQDPAIAALLNRFTIPVKLDRELQPALDARLLAFVRKTRGHGGWPLNVFLTSQGHPLLGLVYAQPEAFRTLLENLERAWQQDPAPLARLALQAARSEHQAVTVAEPRQASALELRQSFADHLWAHADELGGGFGEQSKFPQVPLLQTLLFLQQEQPSPRRREFLALTLQQMARLGLQDQLGGGFFRYTTDPGWSTPHFEKMLYDNAQLLGLYAQAAALWQDSAWLRVAERTFAFLQREMRAAGGGYVASLSALDGAGVEGGYYRWTEAQLRQLLSAQDYQVARHWYGLEAQAATDILPLRLQDVARVQARTGLTAEALAASVRRVKHNLLQARRQRSLPRDEKVLAAWNGLLLKGLVQLAEVSGKAEHRQAADELQGFLVRHFWVDGRLWRMVTATGYRQEAELEDYAYVAAGWMAWCRLQACEADLAPLQALVQAAWRRFYGAAGWRLSDASLPGFTAWHTAVEDAALPSPAAILLEVSGWLAKQSGDAAGRRRVAHALEESGAAVLGDPLAYASYVPLLMQRAGKEGRQLPE